MSNIKQITVTAYEAIRSHKANFENEVLPSWKDLDNERKKLLAESVVLIRENKNAKPNSETNETGLKLDQLFIDVVKSFF